MRVMFMPKSRQAVLADALALDVHERADLAAALIESLDPEMDDDVEAAWKAEMDRRLDDLDAGAVPGIPWEEVRLKLMPG